MSLIDVRAILTDRDVRGVRCYGRFYVAINNAILADIAYSSGNLITAFMLCVCSAIVGCYGCLILWFQRRSRLALLPYPV